jgi:hypothetical protein
MESQQPPPPQPARLKARTLKDILAEFDSIDQVVFDPIELEQHRDAQPLLPPTFSATSHPFDYFAFRLAFNSTQLNQCLWWIDIEISQHQRSGVDQPASHIEWN